MKPNNLVEMVKRTVDSYPDNTALMWKKDGAYKRTLYRELWEQVKCAAAGLRSFGVGHNDKVAILSENNPMWPITDLAVCSLGAVSVPIYPTLTPEQTLFILKNVECQVAVVENARQAEKVLQADEPLNQVFIMFPSASLEVTDQIMSFEDLLNQGRRNPLEDWEKIWRSVTRENLATIIHTSGTTGNPKGAMLSHGNFLSNVEAVQFWVMECRPDDVFLSYLPLSHVFERMSGQFIPLSTGAAIAYAESIDKIQDNMLEVRPTVMTSVPRLFEKVYAKVMDQIESGPAIKKKVFDWAIQVGMERYDYLLKQPQDVLLFKELPPNLRRKWLWANRLVYSQIKERLGGRMRALISGGAALNTTVAKFFWAIDIPIIEGYGLTETSPVIAVNPLGRAKVGTVGKPLPNVDVKIDVDGEVLVRGPNVMKGYYKNDEATSKEMVDGWFRTGDIGEVDREGYLKIIDRKKSMIILSTGKNVAPQPIENAINQSVYIEQTLVVGHGRKYVSVIVVPSYEALEPWAKEKSLTYSSKEDLVFDPHVQALLKSEVSRLMTPYAKFERPKKAILLGTKWTVEGGEITPTLKVKMREIEKRYHAEIEKVYEEYSEELGTQNPGKLNDHAVCFNLMNPEIDEEE